MAIPEKNAPKLFFCLLFLAITIYPARAQQTVSKGNSNAPADEVSPPPVRMKLSPAKLPHVTCAGGQLTIVADNSTMSSVFTAIHECIGVEIEVPHGLKDDRTFITLGPGPARDVLNEFLSGTDFDYVIQSSLSDTRAIQSIQLTARTKDIRDGKDSLATADLTMTPARRLWLASRNAGRPTATSEDNESPADESQPGPPVQDSSAPAPVDAKEASAGAEAQDQPNDQKQDQPNQKQDQPKDQSQENSGASAPSTGVPAAAPGTGAAVPTQPPADGSQTTTPEPSPLQKQINQMEQLFEQRKQMNAKPTQPPAQNPDTNQN
jgi:hypothetical protein